LYGDESDFSPETLDLETSKKFVILRARHAHLQRRYFPAELSHIALSLRLDPHRTWWGFAERRTNHAEDRMFGERLAISLSTLATTAEYRTIANLFGVSRSSVYIIFDEVIDVIVDRLRDRFIKLPDGIRKQLDEVNLKCLSIVLEGIYALGGCR
jgi:hypothetical protein